MTIATFKHVKISAIETVVPEKEICIYDETQYYGGSVKKIDRMRKMVGFYKRHVADNETTPADLAYDAAKNLIADTNLDKNSIDALIFVVQQPDVVNPSTAYFIHDKLGLSDDCIATDINQGCAGWVFGLYMASQMIESGTHKKILLLNADTPSVGIDPSNRNAAPIFGDGGTATLLEYTENEVVSHFAIDTKSYGFEAIVSPFSGTRFRCDISKDEDFEFLAKTRNEKIMNPEGKEVPLLGGYMNGLAVFDFTIKVVPETIKKLLEYSKLTREQIPYLCLHQANKQIVQAVGSGAEFDLEKVPYQAFENYGNNTMCSIPTTIGLLPKDAPKKNLLCCGFGNGLISAAAILNLENTFISDIKNFRKPEYVVSRGQYVNTWRDKISGKISLSKEGGNRQDERTILLGSYGFVGPSQNNNYTQK